MTYDDFHRFCLQVLIMETGIPLCSVCITDNAFQVEHEAGMCPSDAVENWMKTSCICSHPV